MRQPILVLAGVVLFMAAAAAAASAADSACATARTGLHAATAVPANNAALEIGRVDRIAIAPNKRGRS